MPDLKSARTAGFAAMALSIAGLLMQVLPAIQPYVPIKYAWVTLALGIIAQGITDPVHVPVKGDS